MRQRVRWTPLAHRGRLDRPSHLMEIAGLKALVPAKHVNYQGKERMGIRHEQHRTVFGSQLFCVLLSGSHGGGGAGDQRL